MIIEAWECFPVPCFFLGGGVAYIAQDPLCHATTRFCAEMVVHDWILLLQKYPWDFPNTVT